MPHANNQGIRIYYEVEGEGPPLVLQHGLSSAGESWRLWGYAADLAADYRLVLVDARGHGQSDKPHDPALYRPDLLAGDVVAVLDDLGIAQAHFWGYSLGARIGSWTAMHGLLPRFRSLILGGISLQAPRPAPAQQSPAPSPLDQALASGSEGFVAWLEQQAKRTLDPAERARLLRNDTLALLALRRGLAAAAGAASGGEDVLPRLTVPCLLYAGEADPICAGARASAQQLPQGAFFSLPGLNHFQAHTRRDVVLPHVRQFLASASRV